MNPNQQPPVSPAGPSGMSPQLSQLVQRGNLQQTPNALPPGGDPNAAAPQPGAPMPGMPAQPAAPEQMQPPSAPGASSATAPTPQQPFDPAEVKMIEGALTSRLKLLSKIQGSQAGIQG